LEKALKIQLKRKEKGWGFISNHRGNRIFLGNSKTRRGRPIEIQRKIDNHREGIELLCSNNGKKKLKKIRICGRGKRGENVLEAGW